jgi:hypothetical protein
MVTVIKLMSKIVVLILHNLLITTDSMVLMVTVIKLMSKIVVLILHNLLITTDSMV